MKTIKDKNTINDDNYTIHAKLTTGEYERLNKYSEEHERTINGQIRYILKEAKII